ncbi:hypothetical protein MAP00_008725 [Monascus purpureus]|nr:hypothetical protein MAP00_008725 [Monascus purpureus]
MRPPDEGDAISFASKNGHADVVELLLRHGSEPNGPHLPLSLAVEADHQRVVELLLNTGADPKGTSSRQPILGVALSFEPLFKLLLCRGASPAFLEGQTAS